MDADTMSDYVDLSIRQFTEAWRLMCASGEAPTLDSLAADGQAVAAIDGVQYIFSGCPIAFFNVAILTERGISSDVLKARGEHACAWASGRGVPWLFVVTHERLRPGTDATAVLESCGLTPMMPLTGMMAQRVSPAARIAEGLQLTVPQDDAGCSAILDVNGLAYGMELEAGKALIGKRSFWTNHVPVLGLTAGKPACSAAVLMIDDHRYVALVATDPGQQRHGYAEAAMRHALDLAARAHGERPSVLHATEPGRPIYERMGYTRISTHTIFMEKVFLAGH
jgi:GNAT superfamily N-acetyltransferase